ncbi:Flp family type IVb pilin [Salmonella enterica subsp. enterica serovar Newport]|nr:Flp family type IVb pilin [Salmonella enterica subsp. enterica serovar Newport]
MLKNKILQDYFLMGYISCSNQMQSLKGKCKYYIRKNDGVTAVEYAIVVAGVAAIVLFIFGSGGPVKAMLNDTFTEIQSQVKKLITNTTP